MSLRNDITCWIVTEGLKGTENQCLGVAEALNVSPVIKQIRLKQPWKALSPYLKFEQGWIFEPKLEPPWPDLLIASGRKSIAASRFIKNQSNGKTFTVQIQDPRIDSSQFDLVAVPAHDPARGKNVIVTTAAPNRITQSNLFDARKDFPEFEKTQKPKVAVLIGGNSKDYILTRQTVDWMVEALLKQDAFFMVTLSRRTPEKFAGIIQDALKDKGHFVWDGTGVNPYFAMLSYADYVMVSADSVSMISDAATAGKPVYILEMQQRNARPKHAKPDTERRAKRIELFHQLMAEKGIARTFQGELEPPWSYEPLNDAARIAEEIRVQMGLKG